MNINDNYRTSESQSNRIYQYLVDGNRITSLEALHRFGCMRLASRISDIRKQHPELDIKVDKIIVSENKRVAEYYIAQ